MYAVFMSIGLLGGCRETSKLVLEEEQEPIILDADEDGFLESEDCDDSNSLINPNALEECDGFDNDCNGEVDEGVTQIYFADADGDGFGDPDSTIESCDIPEGYVLSGNDCDDNNPDSYPANPNEECDGVDNDCDGEIDEGVMQLYFADADGDSFGDPDAGLEACELPEGYVLDSTDCDDTNADTYPQASERCDDLDNDCDGDIDEDLQEVWYPDVDEDGFGSPEDVLDTCNPPAGYTSDNTDCDDAEPLINPAATEICDGLDNDCDTLLDDDDDSVDYSTAGNYYEDNDGDGYGGNLFANEACAPPPGTVANADDCDDSNASVYPGAPEDCDLIDNDCDGLIDADDPDVQGALTWYADDDRDGFGDSSNTLSSCEEPEGYSSVDGDCDDGDAAINPAARENCDNVDEDCNGLIDDGALGSESTCPGQSCNAILLDGSDDGDGIYWLDPDEDGQNAIQAWCDMTTDGGGWTRLFGSLYPTFWESLSWESHGSPEYDDYSMLNQRSHFSDSLGVYTFRLQLAESGNWDTNPADHQTIWEQAHDPFSESSDGSDYVLISGTEASTCGGFNGLHDSHYDGGGLFARSTDQDSVDNDTCWWLQIVPLQQYGSSSIYNGYVDGYGGSSGVHVWQQLWVK